MIYPVIFFLPQIYNFLTDKHSLINSDLLYYGNDRSIKIVNIKIAIEDGETKELVIKPEDVLEYTINAPCKLHGFFENGFSRIDKYILCVVETEDN